MVALKTAWSNSFCTINKARLSVIFFNFRHRFLTYTSISSSIRAPAEVLAPLVEWLPYYAVSTPAFFSTDRTHRETVSLVTDANGFLQETSSCGDCRNFSVRLIYSLKTLTMHSLGSMSKDINLIFCNDSPVRAVFIGLFRVISKPLSVFTTASTSIATIAWPLCPDTSRKSTVSFSDSSWSDIFEFAPHVLITLKTRFTSQKVLYFCLGGFRK